MVRLLGAPAFVPAVLALSSFGLAPARGQTQLWYFNEMCIDLDSMGDVDGDGVSDLVVDAQNSNGVKILSGVDGRELSSFALGSSYVGYSVARLGDFDGDGYVDFIVGDPFFVYNFAPVGYVAAVSGKDGSQLYYYQGRDFGIAGFEHYTGCCVAGVGDFNNDGLADLGYGIYENPQYSGGWPGPSRIGNQNTAVDLVGNIDISFDLHPRAMTGMGDVNGDGRDDIAVSRVGNYGYGYVDLRSGSRLYNVIRDFKGTYTAEHFGIAIGSCGDLDGDGVRELLVGSTGSNENGTDAGRVDVYSGATGTLLQQVFGTVAGQRFGIDVDGLGDVDGDSFPDFVVASLGTTGVADGRIEVFSGGTGRQLVRIDAAVYRVRGAGDLNGDGVDDVVSTAAYGSISAWELDLEPTLASVTPARIRYDQLGTLAVHGTGFTSDPNLVVTIDGILATNVAVTSFTDLMCTPPPALATGPHDVTVSTQFGTATLAGGLVLTPAVFVDGDALLGATLDLRFEFDPLDSTFAIVGYPPQVAIPTPPFDGSLGIVPFVRLFTLIAYPTDEYVLQVTVPNDPALIGVDVLLQSLTGPKLGGKNKDGAWTNVATISIH